MANERKIDMVILGLLSHEPMTGYDIKKLIDAEIHYFWKGSFGSIYPALSAMERDGLIKRQESDAGKRERIFYSITEDGTKVLMNWLTNTQSKNEMKYETLMKLFFGGVAGEEITLHTIEDFEYQVKKDLAQMKLFKENLSGALEEKDHIYYYLTVLFGIETFEGYLRWCETAKKILQK